MTERDIKNLKFLLTAGEERIVDWYHQASPRQLRYAMELLNAYHIELDAHNLEIQVEKSDMKESKEVLSKFMKH